VSRVFVTRELPFPALDRLAAARHSADMVRRRYFSHVSPDGGTLRKRIAASGYLNGASYWTLGEVLAWAGGRSFTPAGVVKAWMRSPAHKRALLIASFREIGIGITHGIPANQRHGATWTANMGRRG